MWTLYHSDCLDTLTTLEANSLDAVVTDPPYGLSAHPPEYVAACLTAWVQGRAYVPSGSGFMGKAWDAWVPGPEIWREVYRVLKPGGHMLVFAGTRSSDLMSIAIRLAGFELRDTLVWMHGSGFPKGQDIGKALDKMAGAEREVVGKASDFARDGAKRRASRHTQLRTVNIIGDTGGGWDRPITTPATPEAQQWDGWNTNLKPAYEPVLLCRKPLDGTVAENVRRWGVGGLNIDACRVGTTVETWPSSRSALLAKWNGKPKGATQSTGAIPNGRYPANLIHDGSDEVLACFPVTAPGKRSQRGVNNAGQFAGLGGDTPSRTYPSTERGHTDAGGTAARFFYCAKASRRERNAGLEGMPPRAVHRYGAGIVEGYTPEAPVHEHNHHPTVKPQALMQYLCKLITPEGGTILDPFAGSGSTGVAAISLGYSFIGIEREADYVEIAKRRLEDATGERGIVERVPETGEPIRRTVQQLSLFEV